ncbi:MAG: signal peptidase I [Actinomycetes bacterium]
MSDDTPESPEGAASTEGPSTRREPTVGDDASTIGTMSGFGEESEAQSSDQRSMKQKSAGRTIGEWVVVLLLAFLAAFVVRTFVFQTFFIPSGSMEPTLQVGDRIIVSKLSYSIHSVHRGDIVVFHAPPAEATACADPSVKDLVKRVIGLPGETISSSGENILINGKVLKQPWFPVVPLGPPIETTQIPADSFFVMGDNRTNSCDSRAWGTLPRHNMIGHVIFRIWPISQIGIP